eukprot:gene30467-36824_t
MNPALPKEWSSFYVANSTVNAAVDGYYVTSMFQGSGAASCSNEPYMVSAVGLGACIVGVDQNGKSVSANKYGYSKQDNQFLYLTMTMYGAPFDCSGTPTYSGPMTLPLACANSNGMGYRYSYAPGSSSTPWASYNKGIVVQNYYAASACSGPADSWTAIAFGACLQIQDNDSNAQSMRYSKCVGGSMTETTYSDAACGSELKSVTTAPTTCYKGDHATTFETIVCNN